MFIPNTYQLYWNITPRDFVYKMAGEYKKFWNTARREKAAQAGLSPEEVIILASIVEEETVKRRIPHHRRRLHKPFEKRYSFSSLSHPQICLGRFYLAENIDQTYRNRFSVQYL